MISISKMQMRGNSLQIKEQISELVSKFGRDMLVGDIIEEMSREDERCLIQTIQ